MITRLKAWWVEVLLDWALQAASRTTKNGRAVREMIAAYHDTFKE